MRERKLNVLILENSKVIAVRLMETIMELEEIDEILYAPTFDKPINLLLSNRVDIVLCSISLSDDDVTKLAELKSLCKPFSLIVLSQGNVRDYTKKYAGLPVDYFVDISTCLEKLPAVLIDASYALNNTSEHCL